MTVIGIFNQFEKEVMMMNIIIIFMYFDETRH